jgi:hypothetical protein
MRPWKIFAVVSTVLRIARVARYLPANTYVRTEKLNEQFKWMSIITLPLPGSLELKHVLLRIGIPNYICTGNNNDTPGSISLFALDRFRWMAYPMVLIWKLDETDIPTSSRLDT